MVDFEVDLSRLMLILQSIPLTTLLPHSLVLLFWHIFRGLGIIDLRQTQCGLYGALLVFYRSLAMDLGQELLDAAGEGLGTLQQFGTVQAHCVPCPHEVALMPCAQAFLQLHNQFLLLLSAGAHELGCT